MRWLSTCILGYQRELLAIRQDERDDVGYRAVVVSIYAYGQGATDTATHGALVNPGLDRGPIVCGAMVDR